MSGGGWGERLGWATYVVLLFVFWLGLAGALDGPEIIAALLSGAAAALFMKPVAPPELFRLPFQFSVLRATLRAPVLFGRDLARLGRVLVRAAAQGDEGLFVIRTGFAGTSPVERAAVLFGVSFLPNSCAVGVDSDRDASVLLVHELEATDER